MVSSKSEAEPDAGVKISALRQSVPWGQIEALFAHDCQFIFLDCEQFSSNKNNAVGRTADIAQVTTQVSTKSPSLDDVHDAGVPILRGEAW